MDDVLARDYDLTLEATLQTVEAALPGTETWDVALVHAEVARHTRAHLPDGLDWDLGGGILTGDPDVYDHGDALRIWMAAWETALDAVTSEAEESPGEWVA